MCVCVCSGVGGVHPLLPQLLYAAMDQAEQQMSALPAGMGCRTFRQLVLPSHCHTILFLTGFLHFLFVFFFCQFHNSTVVVGQFRLGSSIALRLKFIIIYVTVAVLFIIKWYTSSSKASDRKKPSTRKETGTVRNSIGQTSTLSWSYDYYLLHTLVTLQRMP